MVRERTAAIVHERTTAMARPGKDMIGDRDSPRASTAPVPSSCLRAIAWRSISRTCASRRGASALAKTVACMRTSVCSRLHVSGTGLWEGCRVTCGLVLRCRSTSSLSMNAFTCTAIAGDVSVVWGNHRRIGSASASEA